MPRRRPLTRQQVRQLVSALQALPAAARWALAAVVVVAAAVYFSGAFKPRDPADAGSTYSGDPTQPGTFLFCFWNVENLFDDRDDKRNSIDDPYDDAFAANRDLLQLKLDRISSALLKMNGGRGPDVIACAEVETVRAAELLRDALNANLAGDAPKYKTVAMKNLNAGRHIAPCVITRLGLDPSATRLHGGNLRILETKLRVNDHDLGLIVSHWTSQLRQWDGGDGDAGREKYARLVHVVVSGLTRRNPAADVLVCGDFNDTPDAEPVVRDLRATGDRAAVVPRADDPLLLDLMAGKPPERFGTLWYGGRPLIYDHICVSAGMLDGIGWGCDPDSVHTVTDGLTRPGATRREPWRFDRPDRDNVPDRSRGFADHFPVTVRLTVRPAANPPAVLPE